MSTGIQAVEQQIKKLGEEVKRKEADEAVLLRNQQKYQQEQQTTARQISQKQTGVDRFEAEQERHLQVRVAEKQREVDALKAKYERAEEELGTIREKMTTLQSTVQQLEAEQAEQKRELERIKRIQKDEELRANRERELAVARAKDMGDGLKKAT